MKNVYFSVQDYQIIKEIIEVANHYEHLHVVGFSTILIEEVGKLEDLHLDILVFQFNDDPITCANFLSNLTNCPQLKDTQIFALLKEIDMNTLQLLMRYNIKNFLLEPIRIHHLMNMLQMLGEKNVMLTNQSYDMDIVASRLLQEMGLPMHLSGFRYIKTCAILISKDRSKRRFVIGKVYEECARIHESTASRVEKAIRTSVTYAFRTQPEQICIYNEKPTNTQIILYICEKLKQNRIS